MAFEGKGGIKAARALARPFVHSYAPFVYSRTLCVLACPICVSSRPTRAPFRLDFSLCTRVPFMYSYVLCVIARSLCTHAPFCVLPRPVCVLTHPFCTRVPFVYSCGLYVLTCLFFLACPLCTWRPLRIECRSSVRHTERPEVKVRFS